MTYEERVRAVTKVLFEALVLISDSDTPLARQIFTYLNWPQSPSLFADV